MILGAKRFF